MKTIGQFTTFMLALLVANTCLAQPDTSFTTFFDQVEVQNLVDVIEVQNGYLALGNRHIAEKSDFSVIYIDEQGRIQDNFNYDFGDDNSPRGIQVIGEDTLLVYGGVSIDGEDDPALFFTVDSEGNILDQHTIAIENFDVICEQMTIGLSDGYYLAGSATDDYLIDLFVSSVNPDGSENWRFTKSTRDFILSAGLHVISEDSILVTGHFMDNQNDGDAFLLFLNGQGEEIGWVVIETELPNFVSSSNIIGDTVVLFGDTYDENIEDKDFQIIKSSLGGEVEWIRIVEGDEFEQMYHGKTLNDGNMIFVGSSGLAPWEGSQSAAVIHKLDSEGNTLWQKPFGGRLRDRFNYVIQGTDHAFVMVGFTQSFSEDGDYVGWMVKTEPDPSDVKPEPQEHYVSEFQIQSIHPNPSNSSFVVEFQTQKTGYFSIRLYSIDGRIVKSYDEQSFDVGNSQFVISDPIMSGSYILKVIDDAGVETFSRIVVVE